MIKANMHKIALEELVTILQGQDLYNYLERNLMYGNSVRVIGEIDLVGYITDFNTHIEDYYEVKSTFGRRNAIKALSQLKRARNYFRKNGKNYLYTPQRGIMSVEEVEDFLNEYK